MVWDDYLSEERTPLVHPLQDFIINGVYVYKQSMNIVFKIISIEPNIIAEYLAGGTECIGTITNNTFKISRSCDMHQHAKFLFIHEMSSKTRFELIIEKQ